MLGHPRVGPRREDPGPGRLGGLEETLAEAALQPGLQLEVGLAAVDRDEEFGLLQAPLAEEEGRHQLGAGVVRQADVLEEDFSFMLHLIYLLKAKKRKI